MRKTDLSEGKSPDPEQLSHASFDRCLVDSDSAVASCGRSSRRQAFGLSFAIEVGLLALVILSPLMTTVAQPHLAKSLYIPFSPGSPLRPKPGVKPAPPNRPIRYVFGSFPTPSGLKPSAPLPPGTDAQGSAIEGFDPRLIGETGLVVSALAQPLRPVVPPEEITKSADKRPLKLSEGVVEAQLISRIEPRYPPLAQQTRTQGTVRLQAIISRDGRITSLMVLSGHPLLVQAALDAVRQWRYRPTMLDGEAVEVETTITVVFQLHN